MSGSADRRGGWRIEFGQGGRRPGTPGGPRGPRGPLRPVGGGGDGDGDDPRGPIRPPLSPRARRIAWIVLAVLLVLIIVFLRPLLHTPVMWIWRAPLPWIAALIVLGIGRLLGNRARLTVADLQAGRYPGRGVWASSFAIAGLVFFVLQAVNPLLVERSLAKHTTFTSIDGLPATGQVRLVPKEVADAVLTGSFASSTESLTDLAVVNTPTGLQWSAIRTPQGIVRRYSKKSQGLLLLDAENTTRISEQKDAQFKFAPGLAIFDSLTWQLRKRRLLADLAAPVGILDADKNPLILVPYITYTGFPIRRPKLGGAFLVHPNGQIDDFSPEQAQKNSVIAKSGRLYPDTLARRIQDAYAMRGGISNYLFLHNGQTKIVDTELNRQPYLLQGPNGENFWVSTAEPYGRSAATSAVFVTDSTTGAVKVWKIPENQPLTGNARALKAVQSLTIPGVTFASSSIGGGQSGQFRAVEPRPVFVKGKLYFVISIVPDNDNNVSKTVFIDATTNQNAGVYDADEEGLAKTLDFLKNGPAAGTDGVPATTPAPTTPAGTTPATSTGSGTAGKRPTEAELRARVEAAIKRQSAALDDLKALQRDLNATTP